MRTYSSSLAELDTTHHCKQVLSNQGSGSNPDIKQDPKPEEHFVYITLNDKAHSKPLLHCIVIPAYYIWFQGGYAIRLIGR